MLETFITVVHVLTAIFMILVVLLQGGNSGGVGAAFGGGNSTGFFGATGATSLFGKLTYGAAAVFMITSISLTIIENSSPKMTKRLEERAKKEADKPAVTEPAKDPAPAQQN